MIVILLLAVMPAFAQGSVTASLTTDLSVPVIGDVVPLELSVTHPAGWRIIPPSLGRQWGELEIVAQHPPQIAQNASGTETTTQRIDAQVFSLGEIQTPPLTITVVDTAGQTSQHEVAPLTLTIQSVLSEGDTDLRDIKPQAAMEIPPISPVLIGGVALGVLAVVVLATLFARRLRRAPVMIDKRSIGQRTHDELTHVQRLNLIEQDDYKQHYALVSKIVREYIEGIYHISALDRTTSEVMSAFEEVNILPEHARFAGELLYTCDLVKFSKLVPTPEEAQQIVEMARQFIFMTEPLHDEPETVENAA